MSTNKKLEGKIALITGGSSGLGLSTAKRFVAEGAHVFITGRRQPELDNAVKEIGGSVTSVRGDVSDLADLDQLFATIKEQKGRLDILFANAGGGAFAPLGHVTEAHFDKYFGINVKGTVFTVQKALPLIPAGGVIVINGSMVSIKGIPGFGVYAATKAALRSFARTWSVDLKGRNIRVNVVSPGPILTPIFERNDLPGEERERLQRQLIDAVPMKRLGKPEEVAGVVAFLASSDASFITGEEIHVDGGMGQV